IFGADGGFKLNLPDKLNFGIFGNSIFGIFNFILEKKDFISSTISPTLFLAIVIGSIIASFASLNFVLTLPTISLALLVTLDFISLNRLIAPSFASPILF